MAGQTKRTLTAVLAAAAAFAVIAVAATSGLGAGAGDNPPRWGKVTIDLSKSAPNQGGGGTRKPKEPRIVYLKSGDTLVDPVAIGTPYINIQLTGCRKVIDGGIVTQDHDIYVQGSDVVNPGRYDVRIGFDDAAAASLHPFTITSHLTCLKGVK
jgi:hypothetical protein